MKRRFACVVLAGFLSACGSSVGARSLDAAGASLLAGVGRLECKAPDGQGSTNVLTRTSSGWSLAIDGRTLRSATCEETAEKIHCGYGLLFLDVLKVHARLEAGRVVVPAVEGGFVFGPVGYRLLCRS